MYEFGAGEFNNNSRKSELYGTPHWWPLEQEGAGDDKSGRMQKLKTCVSGEYEFL